MIKTADAIASLSKSAAKAVPAYVAAMSGPSAYSGLQQYLPLGPTRKLSPSEEETIEEEEQKIIPRIFTANSDNPAVDMSSPGWTAALTGGLGAMSGSMFGAAAGHGIGRGSSTGTALGAILGALGGGALLGLPGYFSRKAKNNTIKDFIRRLPRGATRRDVMADPVYQRDQDRAALIAAMMAGAATR
jgi:hypothetical protein